MTVAELIHQLQQFRDDARVKIQFTNHCADEGKYDWWKNVESVVVYSDEHTPTVTIVAEDD